MRTAILAIVLVAATMRCASVPAQSSLPAVGFDPHLGTALPRDARVVDDTGAATSLGAVLEGHASLFVLGYYACSNLCGVVLDATRAALRDARLAPGEDVEVVVLSIDPSESVSAARERKRRLLGHATGRGWHFLTARADAIGRIAAATGLRYARTDDRDAAFAHPAGILVISPSGRITRYFPGVAYAPEPLRTSIAEARREVVAPAQPLRWMRCFHDALANGRLDGVALGWVRAGALLVLLALAALLLKLRRPRAGGAA